MLVVFCFALVWAIQPGCILGSELLVILQSINALLTDDSGLRWSNQEIILRLGRALDMSSALTVSPLMLKTYRRSNIVADGGLADTKHSVHLSVNAYIL